MQAAENLSVLESFEEVEPRASFEDDLHDLRDRRDEIDYSRSGSNSRR